MHTGILQGSSPDRRERNRFCPHHLATSQHTDPGLDLVLERKGRRCVAVQRLIVMGKYGVCRSGALYGTAEGISRDGKEGNFRRLT